MLKPLKTKIIKLSISVFFLFICSTVFAEHKILVFGDSLSNAYGIEKKASWVALLKKRIKSQNVNAIVINKSISGETTAGGLRRIEGILESDKPTIVILELGANDGLRGLSLEKMSSNIEQMINLSKAHKAKCLLVGMHIPPNYGPEYTNRFHEVFTNLAAKTNSKFVPFMLEGFELNDDFFLSDLIHPNERAQPIILETIWKKLKMMIAS